MRLEWWEGGSAATMVGGGSAARMVGSVDI